MRTKEKLLDLITRMFDEDLTNKLDPDGPLASDDLDSLSVAELLFAVEDEFQVTLPSDLNQLMSLNQLVAVLDELVSRQAAQPVQ